MEHSPTDWTSPTAVEDLDPRLLQLLERSLPPKQSSRAALYANAHQSASVGLLNNAALLPRGFTWPSLTELKGFCFTESGRRSWLTVSQMMYRHLASSLTVKKLWAHLNVLFMALQLSTLIFETLRYLFHFHTSLPNLFILDLLVSSVALVLQNIYWLALQLPKHIIAYLYQASLSLDTWILALVFVTIVKHYDLLSTEVNAATPPSLSFTLRHSILVCAMLAMFVKHYRYSQKDLRTAVALNTLALNVLPELDESPGMWDDLNNFY